jgi:hypothetical protein
MTGSELKDFVKHMLFEDAAGGTSLASDTQLATTISIANQKIWSEAAKRSPSFFAKRSPDIACPEGGLDFATIDPNLYQISSVHLKTGPREYVALSPVLPQDAPRYGQGFFGASRVIGYSIEGEHLYLAPDLTADIRVSYLPALGNLASADQALGGKLAIYHPAVAYEACVMLAVKDEANVAGYKMLRDELMKQMFSYIARRQIQNARAIRSVPFE